MSLVVLLGGARSGKSSLAVRLATERAAAVTLIATAEPRDEEMAARIGVINQGEIILVEEKSVLMKKLGQKRLTLQMRYPLQAIPGDLEEFGLLLGAGGMELVYTYDTQRERTGIATLLSKLSQHGITIRDLQTSESSLEDIFVSLVSSSR